jgi:hypothetical protein
VAYRRADGWNARHRGLQDRERSCFVSRGHNEQLCGLDKRAQLPLRQKSVKSHSLRKSQALGLCLHFPRQRIVAGKIYLEAQSRRRDLSESAQQR